LKSIIHDKEPPIWIFATIEVWSRVWPSIVVGRRSYRKTLTNAFLADWGGRLGDIQGCAL
jgi:hypothetical protein